MFYKYLFLFFESFRYHYLTQKDCDYINFLEFFCKQEKKYVMKLYNKYLITVIGF